MLDSARGASHYALAVRVSSHRGRAVGRYLRSAIATVPPSPAAARRRHRPREVQVRRRALALAGVIAGAQRSGSWASMQPRHQQLTLAMLRWYEAGAPLGREPSSDVPIEEWLTPQQTLPPQSPASLPASRPYGERHSCALSLETLEDRYRQELERADRYGTPIERVFARGRARDRLHDRYQLRRAIRASTAATGADPEPVSTAVQPGSIVLSAQHPVPSVRLLTRLEERLEEADDALSDLTSLGAALSRATAQCRELERRLRLWRRAAEELARHVRPLQQQPPLPRLPAPAPLDMRVFEVPRHQLWRQPQLAASLLGSIESLLDALAVRVPAAAALVRRFEAWEALTPRVTQSHEYDIRVPDDEQSREQLFEREQQQLQFERHLRPSLRELPPRRTLASGSPDWTGMASSAAIVPVESGIVEICLAAIVSAWDTLGRVFQR